jgi:hypothetical protein
MLIRLLRELGRLLALLWAEQAICAAGRDPGRRACARARGLAATSGRRRDAAAG